jgi:hypothetical protein
MKIRKSILTTSTGILLAVFGGMALAGPNPQKQQASGTKQVLPKSNTKAVNSVSRGTITSIDNQRLMMSRKKKDGKTEAVTFMLNSQTERKGDLKPGSKISVHYKNENNQLIATAVQAMPQRTASTAKKPVVKK